MATENLKHIDRWFPTQSQLSDPSNLERTLRQILTQHYALQDRVNASQAEHTVGQTSKAVKKGPPPGCGPSDTQILGLRVAPIDVQQLADGAQLTFVKNAGNFQFK
jgi:hypothetical protein